MVLLLSRSLTLTVGITGVSPRDEVAGGAEPSAATCCSSLSKPLELKTDSQSSSEPPPGVWNPTPPCLSRDTDLLERECVSVSQSVVASWGSPVSGNFRSNGRGHGVTRESGEGGGFDEEGATHPSSQRGRADCHPPVVLYTPTV